MLKSDAIEKFRREILPVIEDRHGASNTQAIREAWDHQVAQLRKGGHITQHQADSWINPF